jgi:hypothetical protein
MSLLRFSTFCMRQGDEDNLCWVPSKGGKFDVRSFYSVLVPHDSTSLPMEEYMTEIGSV